jgi:hypothetical protein
MPLYRKRSRRNRDAPISGSLANANIRCWQKPGNARGIQVLTSILRRNYILAEVDGVVSESVDDQRFPITVMSEELRVAIFFASLSGEQYNEGQLQLCKSKPLIIRCL